jgi:hypothetical protein
MFHWQWTNVTIQVGSNGKEHINASWSHWQSEYLIRINHIWNQSIKPLVFTSTRLFSMSFHLQEILSSLDCFVLLYIIYEWIGIQRVFTLKHHNTRPSNVKPSLEACTKKNQNGVCHVTKNKHGDECMQNLK